MIFKMWHCRRVLRYLGQRRARYWRGQCTWKCTWQVSLFRFEWVKYILVVWAIKKTNKQKTNKNKTKQKTFAIEMYLLFRGTFKFFDQSFYHLRTLGHVLLFNLKVHNWLCVDLILTLHVLKTYFGFIFRNFLQSHNNANHANFVPPQSFGTLHFYHLVEVNTLSRCWIHYPDVSLEVFGIDFWNILCY